MRDVLLQLVTYPDPVPDEALSWAHQFSQLLEASLSLEIFEVDIQAPSNPLANALLNLPAMAAAQRARSAETARRYTALASGLETHFGSVAAVTTICSGHDIPSLAARTARLRDVAVVPLLASLGQQQDVAEAIAFGGGGPVLVVPAESLGERPSLRRIVVAWDFGAPAASAIAHAMPLLRRAEEVVVLIVVNEKSIPATSSASRLALRLALNDVNARVYEEDASGRKIGEVLSAYVAGQRFDLLVMGAFGHSRMSEFILGGATRSVLQAPPCPVLMAH
ncbi:MAG: universal stress protein [Caulobacteraceae bacterium]|nr:universal stress protein [Caulobacteraceae bacterium]